MKLFHPIIAGAHLPDRLVACVGALACIALTILLCSALGIVPAALPIIVAPIGASAVLVFAVPASPLAQPWPVIGGNIVSALVGVVVVQHVVNPALAAGLAVGGAILVMSLLRCLHPPGGAAALTAVIGGSAVHAAGWSFAFVPVGLNSLALVALGILFHRTTRHSYPHRPAQMPLPDPSGLHLADIDAALDDMHESFDISRADLDALLTRAEVHALARRGR
ncbi:HPP family protein [Sphingomonas sp. MMS24-J45]|uniref:HPP family protein n=1 Tax=Sphingomonas sp. MMS24-J45 TaxID=3238806 RepID=UPI00384C40B0